MKISNDIALSTTSNGMILFQCRHMRPEVFDAPPGIGLTEESFTKNRICRVCQVKVEMLMAKIMEV